jgi:hypothetical protein
VARLATHAELRDRLLAATEARQVIAAIDELEER